MLALAARSALIALLVHLALGVLTAFTNTRVAEHFPMVFTYVLASALGSAALVAAAVLSFGAERALPRSMVAYSGALALLLLLSSAAKGWLSGRLLGLLIAHGPGAGSLTYVYTPVSLLLSVGITVLVIGLAMPHLMGPPHQDAASRNDARAVAQRLWLAYGLWLGLELVAAVLAALPMGPMVHRAGDGVVDPALSTALQRLALLLVAAVALAAVVGPTLRPAPGGRLPMLSIHDSVAGLIGVVVGALCAPVVVLMLMRWARRAAPDPWPLTGAVALLCGLLVAGAYRAIVQATTPSPQRT
jgi:hypothetical protein